MALESGTKLGTYEISDMLGKGGMGEVYRARDTKLGREVAIKVLPAEFSQDQERLARLEREARMLAALNHPNIAAIYGLEQSDDTRFLVLELVEGDTLADRLKHGAIPVEEALKLALQIAEALEAAHEKGVIHRDLKPANIKITADGHVKVLDFGLAKALIGEQEDVSLSNSPTLSLAATQKGVILGTAAYMSPEQASGEVADHRADVWALGVVLFEMLTGRQLFTGKTASHVMGAVLNIEPEWDRLPANLHPRARVLLERLLEKEPQDRLSGISDARVEIRRVLADPNGVVVQAVPEVVPQARLPWIVAVVLTAVVIGMATWLLKPPDPRQVVRFSHLLGGEAFTQTNQPSLTISPDGMQVVYVADERLYLLNLNEYEAQPIPGTDENPDNPDFSPDGQSLVFRSSEGALKTIAVAGGAPVPITPGRDLPNVRGVSWEANGMILYADRDDESIWQVPATGGEPERIVEPREGESIYGPTLLPGGDFVLYSAAEGQGVGARWDEGQIFAESLLTGERTPVMPGGADARYVSQTGHLVFAFEGDLFAIGFDPETLRVSGRPVTVVQGVRRGISGTAHYDISETGTLVHVPGEGITATEAFNLAFLDREGSIDEVVEGADIRSFIYPRLSPDDTRIAVQIDGDDGPDIWIYDLLTMQPRQLTLNGGERPLWSPDGSEITFLRDQGLWTIRSDFTGGEVALPGTEVEGNVGPGSWSQDGSVLLFASDEGIHAWQRGGSGGDTAPIVVPSPPGGAALFPEFAPDGSHFVYSAAPATTGEIDLYGETYPPANPRRITTDGGLTAVWVRNGGELISLLPTGLFHSRAITTEPVLDWGNPVGLFSGRQALQAFPAIEDRRNYDLTRDGERFLVRLPAADVRQAVGPPRINVVLNWFEYLGERVTAP